jgi:hypothetical protein
LAVSQATDYDIQRTLYIVKLICASLWENIFLLTISFLKRLGAALFIMEADKQHGSGGLADKIEIKSNRYSQVL